MFLNGARPFFKKCHFRGFIQKVPNGPFFKKVTNRPFFKKVTNRPFFKKVTTFIKINIIFKKVTTFSKGGDILTHRLAVPAPYASFKVFRTIDCQTYF